jgi:D-alanyl-D-alanine carboxypeptidase
VLRDATGRNRAGEITLRRLLMHRGGLPHQPAALDPRSVGSDWSDPDLLHELFASSTLDLVRAPGEYGYSNLGYALLGAVIETVEGTNFADAMAPWLHALEMADSTFWPSAGLDRAAHGRVERDGGVHFLSPGWYTSRYALPFTGLWATAPDMARFGQALLAAGADAGDRLHPLTVLETSVGHGLGPVHRMRLGVRSLEHDGGGPGFTAWLIAIPAHEVSIAFVCNGDGDSGQNAEALLRLTDRLVGEVVETARAR